MGKNLVGRRGKWKVDWMKFRIWNVLREGVIGFTNRGLARYRIRKCQGDKESNCNLAKSNIFCYTTRSLREEDQVGPPSVLAQLVRL